MCLFVYLQEIEETPPPEAPEAPEVPEVNQNGKSDQAGKKKFSCPYCQQAFARRYDMEKHR